MRRLLNEMDSAEITEWMLFDQLEPIGAKRDDFNAASIIANVLRMMGGDTGVVMVSDYMYFNGPSEPQTQEQMMAQLRG